ncbi:hypothetical protein B0H13DRAFT_1893315 [Mycena leptocephala]|nr:hypothetical protein B0H13DRAFT_1893315 [Mycena leptocephala]
MTQNDSDLNGINLEENHRTRSRQRPWCQRLHQGLQSIIPLARCCDKHQCGTAAQMKHAESFKFFATPVRGRVVQHDVAWCEAPPGRRPRPSVPPLPLVRAPGRRHWEAPIGATRRVYIKALARVAEAQIAFWRGVEGGRGGAGDAGSVRVTFCTDEGRPPWYASFSYAEVGVLNSRQRLAPEMRNNGHGSKMSEGRNIMRHIPAPWPSTAMSSRYPTHRAGDGTSGISLGSASGGVGAQRTR